MKTFRWEARYWIVTISFAVVCLALVPVQLILFVPYLVVHPFSELRRDPPLANLVRLLDHSHRVWQAAMLRCRP